jgi:ribonuclease BN (tRNA processing enzyme)
MTTLNFIGSSDAFNHGGRGNSCYWVKDTVGQYMVDFGPTAPAMLEKGGFQTSDLDMIFFTHLHGDHISGIPGLLLHFLFKDQRKRDFYIIGPEATEAKLRELCQVCYPHLLDKPLPFEIKFINYDDFPKKDIHTQDIHTMEILGRKIDLIHAKHDPYVFPYSLGIYDGLDGKRIVFSGDTGWHEKLPIFTKGADIFVCECSYDLPYYDGHLSMEEMFKYRALFDVKQFLLTHMSQASRDLAILAQKQGLQIEVGDDLLRVEID